jgi:hypothetical protein
MNIESSIKIVLDWYHELKSTALKCAGEYLPNWEFDLFDTLVLYTLLLFVIRSVYVRFLKRRLNDEKSTLICVKCQASSRGCMLSYFSALLSWVPCNATSI